MPSWQITLIAAAAALLAATLAVFLDRALAAHGARQRAPPDPHTQAAAEPPAQRSRLTGTSPAPYTAICVQP